MSLWCLRRACTQAGAALEGSARVVRAGLGWLACAAGAAALAGCGLEMEGAEGMVHVPEGDFIRGSDRLNEFDGFESEVYVSEFWIDVHEVKVDQYRECVEEGDCSEPGSEDEICGGPVGENFNNWTQNRGEHPVNCVSWVQANQYCRWAGKRLPTEAEWEKAARGTDGRSYPWGEEEATCDYAVMLGQKLGNPSQPSGCGQQTTWPVGSKELGQSPYGLYDMSGNVSEWVYDWYDGYNGYEHAPRRDPRGPESGTTRVLRGGGFLSSGGLYTFDRGNSWPYVVSTDLGFRCARDQSSRAMPSL